MMQSNPADRPSAEEALQEWRLIRRHVVPLHRHWRPREREESFVLTVVLDTLYAFSSIVRTFRFLGRRLRRPFA